MYVRTYTCAYWLRVGRFVTHLECPRALTQEEPWSLCMTRSLTRSNIELYNDEGTSVHTRVYIYIVQARR